MVVLAALEGIARWARAARGGGREDNPLPLYTEPDPILGWRKKPGARATYRRREYTVELAVNREGLRDRERTQAAAPGTVRVLALGDSFVEGYSVPLEATLTQVMESDLARPRCAVVRNAPVPAPTPRPAGPPRPYERGPRSALIEWVKERLLRGAPPLTMRSRVSACGRGWEAIRWVKRCGCTRRGRPHESTGPGPGPH